jgi:hypothetical protein
MIGRRSLVIEAKGEAANPPQQATYFLSRLGELVQRWRTLPLTFIRPPVPRTAGAPQPLLDRCPAWGT